MQLFRKALVMLMGLALFGMPVRAQLPDRVQIRTSGYTLDPATNTLRYQDAIVTYGDLTIEGELLTYDPSQRLITAEGLVRITEGDTIVAGEHLTFNLAEADLTTALRVADGINNTFGDRRARAVDAVSVTIDATPGAEQRILMMGMIENIEVTPADAPARVIVNARTGTVVINGAVKIHPAAVAHGKLTVSVNESPQIVQPAPFSQGQTAVQQSSNISIDQEKKPMVNFKGGASLADIVKAVNAIGASPADMVAILEALKQAGAMKAELVVL